VGFGPANLAAKRRERPELLTTPWRAFTSGPYALAFRLYFYKGYQEHVVDIGDKDHAPF
jgi:hypothetical protein